MMTDFALEIAFAVFIIQFPNILHFLIIIIITELRGTLSDYPGVDYLVMGYKCYDLTREAPATPAPAPPLHTRQQLDD